MVTINALIFCNFALSESRCCLRAKTCSYRRGEGGESRRDREGEREGEREIGWEREGEEEGVREREWLWVSLLMTAILQYLVSLLHLLSILLLFHLIVLSPPNNTHNNNNNNNNIKSYYIMNCNLNRTCSQVTTTT